ncbi:hypothetical protein MTR67_040499 [Solanum verrucosum]|uniref:Uncharacterized protein n=1 Tax=Solanum verrucosum TaxID=315347 RepID=A0AAF0UKX0_SOLVR|nr:hypothetical protein MTR67_040499 [Solanum verrucosum]
MFEYCSGLETIELVNLQKIKSVSLKVLRIWDCGGIWEIDAPNLVSFEYMGKLIPQLRIARQLEHSNVILYGLDNVNTDWFCKLRKFLSSSNSWFKVTLYIFEYTEIKMEHLLQQHHRVATHQVDVLEVNRLGQNRECSSFVDALNTIQSTSHGRSNPWYSQLKDVKAYKSDWKEESWYPVEHKSLLMVIALWYVSQFVPLVNNYKLVVEVKGKLAVMDFHDWFNAVVSQQFCAMSIKTDSRKVSRDTSIAFKIFLVFLC